MAGLCYAGAAMLAAMSGAFLSQTDEEEQESARLVAANGQLVAAQRIRNLTFKLDEPDARPKAKQLSHKAEVGLAEAQARIAQSQQQLRVLADRRKRNLVLCMTGAVVLAVIGFLQRTQPPPRDPDDLDIP